MLKFLAIALICMSEPNFNDNFSLNYTNCELDIEPDIFPKRRRPEPESFGVN